MFDCQKMYKNVNTSKMQRENILKESYFDNDNYEAVLKWIQSKVVQIQSGIYINFSKI